MADKHVADGESTFKAASVAPDVCRVGNSVIPFDSFQDLSKQKKYVPTVKARSEHVLTVGSVIAGTQGNAGSGVVSGTSLGSGDCTITSGAGSVKAEGKPLARHLSDVSMNNGNTMGKLYTMTVAPNGTIENNKQPCNNPPKRSENLDKLETLKKELENDSLNANQLDKYVDFDGASKEAQNLIDGIRPGQDSLAFTQGAAGVARGALGFLKDAAFGIDKLIYTAAKRLSPVTRQQDQVSAMILAENIRLGNVCMEQIKQQAKAVGKEIVKPVTEPWARGDYAEAVTRGTLEVGTIILPFTKLGKAGEVANVAGKMSEGEKAAEATNVTSKISEGEKAGEAATIGGKMGDVEKTSETGKVAETELSNDVKNAPKEEGVKIKEKEAKSNKPNQRKANKPRQPRKYEKKVINPDGSVTYTLKTKNGGLVDVTYDKSGYPDFSPYKYDGPLGKSEVKIDMTGNNNTDFSQANQAAGFGKGPYSQPDGYTWHHHQDGTTMQLIQDDVHDATPHTGGASSARQGGQ